MVIRDHNRGRRQAEYRARNGQNLGRIWRQGAVGVRRVKAATKRAVAQIEQRSAECADEAVANIERARDAALAAISSAGSGASRAGRASSVGGAEVVARHEGRVRGFRRGPPRRRPPSGTGVGGGLDAIPPGAAAPMIASALQSLPDFVPEQTPANPRTRYTVETPSRSSRFLSPADIGPYSPDLVDRRRLAARSPSFEASRIRLPVRSGAREQARNEQPQTPLRLPGHRHQNQSPPFLAGSPQVQGSPQAPLQADHFGADAIAAMRNDEGFLAMKGLRKSEMKNMAFPVLRNLYSEYSEYKRFR